MVMDAALDRHPFSTAGFRALVDSGNYNQKSWQESFVKEYNEAVFEQKFNEIDKRDVWNYNAVLRAFMNVVRNTDHTVIDKKVEELVENAASREKILFIEEIQSDWHQEGREKGYRTPARAQGEQTQITKDKWVKDQLTMNADLLNDDMRAAFEVIRATPGDSQLSGFSGTPQQKEKIRPSLANGGGIV